MEEIDINQGQLTIAEEAQILAEQGLLPTNIIELEGPIIDDVDYSIQKLLHQKESYVSASKVLNDEQNNTWGMLYTLEVPNMDKIYTLKNKVNIENEILLIAEEIKNIWNDHGYDLAININVGNHAEDRIYFMIEDFSVVWSCLDKEEKWRPGDDFSTWEVMPTADEKMDTAYQEYEELYETIRKEINSQNNPEEN